MRNSPEKTAPPAPGLPADLLDRTVRLRRLCRGFPALQPGQGCPGNPVALLGHSVPRYPAIPADRAFLQLRQRLSDRLDPARTILPTAAG
jgi:hypothetical protein